MRLKFDSESGVFTIKPESEAEITKLRTSATPTSSKQT